MKTILAFVTFAVLPGLHALLVVVIAWVILVLIQRFKRADSDRRLEGSSEAETLPEDPLKSQKRCQKCGEDGPENIEPDVIYIVYAQANQGPFMAWKCTTCGHSWLFEPLMRAVDKSRSGNE